MSRRRVFSTNTETTMGDHIKTVAQTAKQGKYIRTPIPESSVPTTLLEGTTSYLILPITTTNTCQLNKITLYPYGRFNPIINHNKFILI